MERVMYMRKKDRELCVTDSWLCFDQSPYSTLSMIYAGKPYAVALSCARIENTIYFHCAKEGQKREAIQTQPNVWLSSVAYVENNDIDTTTYYTSCMMAGICRLVEDQTEKLEALRCICERYTKQYVFEKEHPCMQATLVYAIDVKEIYGKGHKRTQIS